MPSYAASLAVLAASLLPVAQGYFRITCGTVQTGRIDPLVSPGNVAGHTHTIVGASNINIDSTFDSLQASDCTSCEITADKSAYWTPQMYYQMKNGSIIEVPHDGTVVYYLGRGDNRTFEPFPPGLRMLSGDMRARSYDANTLTASSGGRPVSDRVSFACLDAVSTPETPGLNSTKCANGLRAQIQFQSCWNGVDLYKSDNSHVAYMTQIDNGVCPPTHPHHFVHLFFEVLYGVAQIDQSDGGRFVFAQGDPTGYGFHGDFFNGWNSTVLANALAGGDSGCAGSQDNQVSYCPAFYGLDDPAKGYNCPEYPPVFNEKVHGNVGTSLPGCNNITPGPAAAAASDNQCPAGGNNPTPAKNSNPAQSAIVRASPTPVQATGNTGFVYAGCFDDNVNGMKTLKSPLQKVDGGMTIETCQTYCSSQNPPYKYAGIEYGDECYCGNTVQTTTTANQTFCTMHCAGSKTEVCGGGNLMSLFNNTNISPSSTVPDGAGPTGAAAGVYKGCATDNVSGRALTGASYQDGTNMTLEACGTYCFGKGFSLAGTEYASECYCGNALSNGGAYLADNSTCNMVCKGNRGETCGAGNRLSVFAKPAKKMARNLLA